MSSVGALIIGLGFGGDILYYNSNEEPPIIV